MRVENLAISEPSLTGVTGLMGQGSNSQGFDFLFLLFLQLVQINFQDNFGDGMKEEGRSQADLSPGRDLKKAWELFNQDEEIRKSFFEALEFLSLLSFSVQEINNGSPTSQPSLTSELLPLPFGQRMKALPFFDNSFSLKAELEGIVSQVKDSQKEIKENAKILGLPSDLDAMLFWQGSSLAGKETSKQVASPLRIEELKELSNFIGKLWQDFRALKKVSTAEEVKSSDYEVFKESFRQRWQGLSEGAKAYLKEIFSQSQGQELKVQAKDNKGGQEPSPAITIDTSEGLREGSPKEIKNTLQRAFLEEESLREGVFTNLVKRVTLMKDKPMTEKKGKGLEKVDFVFTFTLEDNPWIKGPYSLKDTRGKEVFVPSFPSDTIGLHQVSDFLKSLVIETYPEGEQRARIQLEPPELGHLDVEIKVKDGEVSLRVKVENPEAYQQIAKEVETIRTHLEEMGLRVKDLVFTLLSGGNNPAFAGQRDAKDQQEERGPMQVKGYQKEALPENNLQNLKGRYYYLA